MTQTQTFPTHVPPARELAGTDLPANGAARNAPAVRSIPPAIPHLNGHAHGSPMLTIEQIVERVQSDDKGKWDIVLPRNKILMRNGRLIFPDAKAYECENGLAPSPWAMGQLCRRLGIPTSYFRKCPTFLQDTQFNHWNTRSKSDACNKSDGRANQNSEIHYNEAMPPAGRYPEEEGYVCPLDEFNNGANHEAPFEDGEPSEYHTGWPTGLGNGHQFKHGIYAGTASPEYWLLRAKDQTLRALLTDRYTPLDNRTLLDCLQRTLPSRLEIQWLALDEESFHLRIIDPTMTREILSGDPLMTGIHISNSETGRRSVAVDCILYRQVCTNGLIKLVKGKSILCQRHVAVSPPHFVALLRQSLSTALSTAESFMEQMAWATTAPLRDVEAEMKSLMTRWQLNQSFVEQVKTSLGNERHDQQETVFGLVNAVTQAAQSLDTESRYEMEILAGKLLERKSLHSSTGSAASTDPAPGRSVHVPTSLRNGSDVAEAIEAAEVLFEAEAIPSAPHSSAPNAEEQAVEEHGEAVAS